MNTSKPTVCFYCADQNPHRDRSLGITSYTTGLLTHLQRSGAVELRAITSKSSFKVPEGIPETRVPMRTDAALGRLAIDHLHPALVRDTASLWHYPKGFLPLARRRGAPPAVGTVHDTILQFYADSYPQTRSRLGFAYWIFNLKSSLARADLVLTVSEFSARCIREFCERYGIRCPPVVVTYQGVQLPEAAGIGSMQKSDYVLHLASTQPHKRTAWLLDTWEALLRDGHALPELRLVGSLSDGVAAQASRLPRCVATGAASATNLGALMANARALLLPSEIEGFGLPAVEAYRLGTPVVYVRDTAVEEILGAGAPGAFEFERSSFFAALEEALGLEATAIQLRASSLAERFSWSRCVELTLGAYRQLL